MEELNDYISRFFKDRMRKKTIKLSKIIRKYPVPVIKKLSNNYGIMLHWEENSDLYVHLMIFKSNKLRLIYNRKDHWKYWKRWNLWRLKKCLKEMYEK